jgi:hypothetical protein
MVRRVEHDVGRLVDGGAGLHCRRPIDAHVPGEDQRPRALSRRRQPARDQQHIKTLAHCPG